MDKTRLVINIPENVDKTLLIAINGNRGRKYFSAIPLKPGTAVIEILEKPRKRKVK